MHSNRLQLPQELWMQIFQNLDGVTLLSVATVCKVWRVMTNCPLLWKQQCQLNEITPKKRLIQDLSNSYGPGVISSANVDWKQVYLDFQRALARDKFYDILVRNQDFVSLRHPTRPIEIQSFRLSCQACQACQQMTWRHDSAVSLSSMHSLSTYMPPDDILQHSLSRDCQYAPIDKLLAISPRPIPDRLVVTYETQFWIDTL